MHGLHSFAAVERLPLLETDRVEVLGVPGVAAAVQQARFEHREGMIARQDFNRLTTS